MSCPFAVENFVLSLFEDGEEDRVWFVHCHAAIDPAIQLLAYDIGKPLSRRFLISRIGMISMSMYVPSRS
jgi:hypothetical protein